MVQKKKPSSTRGAKKPQGKKKPASLTRPKRKKAAEKPVQKSLKQGKYYETVGSRKTATARIRMWTKGEKGFEVNEKPLAQYFPTRELQETALSSLEKMKCLDKFRVSVRVRGGGIAAQAEAIRHATARALTLFNPDFRKRLRRVGYLTRDPRMRERKKFGLKRARKAPQWAKR